MGNKLTQQLRADIMQAAKEIGLDPFTRGFKPSDLGLTASDYGSFSDYCTQGETVSASWNADIILRVVEWNGERPHRYVLLPE